MDRCMAFIFGADLLARKKRKSENRRENKY
jgi:hypothetical protein